MNSRQILRRKILNFAKWIIGCAYLLIGAPGHKSKIIAFVFHEVSDTPRGHARLTNTYSTNKNFMKQIALLSSNFKIIDPLKDPQWVNKSGCLITFDDGYKGALEAAKVLEDLEIASIHFLNLETIYGQFNSSALIQFSDIHLAKVTKWPDSQPRVMKELLSKLSDDELKGLADFSGPYMNQNELWDLNSLTRVTLGDHFLNHWYGNSLTDDEIEENLYLNATRFHGIDKMRPYFASPHGQMDDDKIRVIIKQGYELIFSGSSWRRIENVPIVPRIDMNNSVRSKASLFGAIAILILKSKIKAKNSK
jgi:peptidoglycan/xylan/chitin deacetylase (PgdA/CDA1 family)